MTEARPKLAGQVALVTGGAKRVGRSICLELAEAGCDVAIHCHTSVREAEELAARIRSQGRRAAVLQGDLADPGSWSAVVRGVTKALGRLDVLVHNASVFPRAGSDDLPSFDLAAWDSILRVNLTAVAGLTHHAVEHLVAGGRGRVVTLCDIAAERPWPSRLAYSVSKAGLVALTKALARSLAPHTLVNAVSPGVAAFPEDMPEGERSRIVARIPLARPGTPQDVAQACRFLVESDYITGQVLVVDGGRSVV
jgi:NAD(P)-dependent dehydrogenase (short-subunit alcohol dehydrogenase family)